MKKTIILWLVTLVSVLAQAQVDNYAIRLAQGGSVDCGPMPELNGLDNYTLQFWVCPDRWTSGATLIRRGEGLRIQSASTYKMAVTIGGQTVIVANTFLAAGIWAQVTLLSDGSSLSVLVNGNRVKTFTGRYVIPEDSDSPFLIGGDTFEGRIDEIRVWNTELSGQYDYFVHNTLNKWVPQLDNLVAYFKGDQEQCPNLVDYKPLFAPSEFNHHGTFSPTGASLEKVTDNTGLPYLLNGAYTENNRFFDRAIDRDKYLLSNDLIILGINSYTDGHLEYASPNDHGTPVNAEYLSEFEGRKGVLMFKGEGARLVLPKTAFRPAVTDGVTTKGYTFETWLYLDQWTEGAYLFRKETNDGLHGFSVSLGDEERKEVVVRVNGNKYVNEKRMPIGQWVHFAVTTLQGGTTRTTFLFSYNGTSSYASEKLSDASTDFTPTGMGDCVPYIGEGLSGKLDETVIWTQKFTASEIANHRNSIPLPGIGRAVSAQILMNGSAYFRYGDPNRVGFDSYSQDAWRRIMLTAYKGYRGYQVRISVRGHDGWQNTISNAQRRKTFAADLARLSEGYDGVELDLEWMDGTQTNLGLLADDILEALPEGKTLMISCHAYGAYRFPIGKISKLAGFTFQQYGPQPTYFTYSNFISSYNSFVNYGFPKDKIYLSYSTTTSRGTDANGNTTAVLGVRNGFLERNDYVPSYTADSEKYVRDGYTFSFMGPGQVYRRAKHCVENNLQGIFYWDMGNDVKTAHPYSLSKACAYALNSNVDTLVTEVTPNYPTAIRSPWSSGESRITVRIDGAGQTVVLDAPSGFRIHEVQLFSPTGNRLAVSPGNRLSVRCLPKGAYILRAILSDGTTISRTFVRN